MTISYTLPIRFGHSTRRDLSPEGLQISTEMCKAFFSENDELESIPIEWMSTNFRIARTSLADILRKSIVSTKPQQNLIVDIGGWLHFDAIDPEFHFGIADFLEQVAAEKFNKILVICPGRLVTYSPESAAYRRISSLPNVTMIFLEGNEYELKELQDYFGNTETAAIKSEQGLRDRIRKMFALKLDSSLPDYEKTVVRKPGLFAGQMGGEKFAFTYDFSNGREFALKLCQKQIAILGQRNITKLFYKADRKWFATIVEDAITLSDIPMSAHALSSHETIDDSKLNGQGYAVFCPVVRSGNQFSKLFSHTTNFPEYLWSLGSIDEGRCTYVDERVRKLSLEMADASVLSLDLNFEVSIKTEDGPVPKIWRELSVNVDQLKSPVTKHKLSSSSAWAMMLEAGFGPEDYGPDRAFLDSLPQFGELVAKNGGFLALAFREQILATINRPLSENDLILCVDEVAAKTLAQKIVDTAYEKSICVSRDLLKAFKAIDVNDEGELQEVCELFAEEIGDLQKQVRYAKEVISFRGSRIIQAVIVDEIIVSGDTIETLETVAKIIGLDIQAAISILQTSDEQCNVDFPVRPLYVIPVPEQVWKAT